MALFPGACEFPLLRDQFWRLAAMADQRRSPSPVKGGSGSRSSDAPVSPTAQQQQQPHIVAQASSPLPELPSFSRPKLRQMQSLSVDLGSALRGQHGTDGDGEPSSPPAFAAEQSTGGGGRGRLMGLRSLDLQALPRDDAGPASELGARRQKFALFENQCSEVAPGLCVGGGAVAGNREVLRAASVTHVVNCVGMLVPNAFPDELDYLTLYLNDVPGQDLTSVLYTVFDYIEAARAGGGCVLVHCSQGVSRSAALTIAYLMWKLGQPYDEVYQAVKAIRGVANPNIGFTCQLLQWQKRRTGPPPPVRLLRMAPAATETPSLLVPKAVPTAEAAALDPRGAFVVATPRRTFIWQGSQCPPQLAAAAEEAAGAMMRYEGAPGPPQCILEGSEPAEAAAALTLPQGFAAKPCAAYDADFKVLSEAWAAVPNGESPGGGNKPEADTPAASPGLGLGLRLGPDMDKPGAEGGTPRGSKTPRAARGDGGSPNTRRRKSARADLRRLGSPGRPSQGSLDLPLSDGDDSNEDAASEAASDSGASGGDDASSREWQRA